MSDKCKVGGKVINSLTGQGLKGLRVEAWDKDIHFDDALGHALTDKEGNFDINYSASAFSDRYSEKNPDLYFKIFLAEKLLETTEDALMQNASTYEKQVVIPIRFYEKEEEGLNQFELKGKLTSRESVDYTKVELTVQAFVQGKEVASADVNEKGEYTLTFAQKEIMRFVDIRVVPKLLASPRYHKLPGLGLTRTFCSSKFSMQQNNFYKANYEMMIPQPYLELLLKITKTYHTHGVVYATKFEEYGGIPTPVDITPMPGARIEFFEVDSPYFFLIGTEPTLKESYLGEAVTQPDGSYEFTFDFSYNPLLLHWLFTDKVPDIRARISQFFDGDWTQVYEGPVDWNISEDFARSYFVPEELVIPDFPDVEKPLVGFRYISCGLLPIDTERIKKGYATALEGDPARVAGISHQPFCERLRVFGLFAESDDVRTYKVQIATANEDGPVGDWTDMPDPLYNREWDDTEHKWKYTILGPDPVTKRYTNIDIEPEYDWHEHALKFTWNTKNVPNGYYAIRILGFKEDDTEVGHYYMPVLRVDNTRPDTALDIISPAVSECGYMTLGTDRKITFKVTANDPEGHMYRYSVSCSRGKHPQAAGSTVPEHRPDPEAVWAGVTNKSVAFTVSPLPTELAACPSIAYNAELHVWGSSTDGYSNVSSKQHVKREMNLIVSE